MKKQILLQPAYVLHQRAYRDTSAIIELFTPEHGRVGVVAKGIKRPKSPWRGLLQPFQPLLVSWSGGGELKTLTDVEAQGEALPISPQSLASGFYLNELVMRLVVRLDAQVMLFGVYDAGLRALSAGPAGGALEAVLRYFERDLLMALGYGLVLDHEVENTQIIAPCQLYDYQLERGPVRLLAGDEAQAAAQGIIVHGSTLLAIDQSHLSGELERREAKRLMRAVLARYLGSKPLFSRQMLMRPPTGKPAADTSPAMQSGPSENRNTTRENHD